MYECKTFVQDLLKSSNADNLHKISRKTEVENLLCSNRSVVPGDGQQSDIISHLKTFWKIEQYICYKLIIY